MIRHTHTHTQIYYQYMRVCIIFSQRETQRTLKEKKKMSPLLAAVMTFLEKRELVVSFEGLQ